MPAVGDAEGEPAQPGQGPPQGLEVDREGRGLHGRGGPAPHCGPYRLPVPCPYQPPVSPAQPLFRSQGLGTAAACGAPDRSAPRHSRVPPQETS